MIANSVLFRGNFEAARFFWVQFGLSVDKGPRKMHNESYREWCSLRDSRAVTIWLRFLKVSDGGAET
jgi:hypothetical protein